MQLNKSTRMAKIAPAVTGHKQYCGYLSSCLTRLSLLQECGKPGAMLLGERI